MARGVGVRLNAHEQVVVNIMRADLRCDLDCIWVSDDGMELSLLYNTLDFVDKTLEIDFYQTPAMLKLAETYNLTDEGDYEGKWLSIRGHKK